MKNQLQKLINEVLAQRKVSQKELALELNVSPATISNILNSQWERINERLITKIYSALKPNELKIVQTVNFQNIWEKCDKTRKHKRLACIIGSEGAGKTVALNKYHQTHPNTYKITCLNSMKPKQLFTELINAMGLNYNATIYEMINFLADEINKRTDPLILIDEVSAMSQTCILYLKDLWDKIENNCGIVLCGMDYFKTNILKAVDKNKIGMPEFVSRISSYLHLNKPTFEEIKFICNDNGINDIEFIKSISWIDDFRILGNTIKNYKEDINDD